MGDIVLAVDRYADIPVEVRQRLQRKMRAHDYDDVALIRRDTIEGRRKYESRISDMHFGEHTVCHEVSRTGWTPGMHERGLVYCEGVTCLLVPTVCRNLSRITLAPDGGISRPGPGDPSDAWVFDPPAAIGAPAMPLDRLPDDAQTFQQLALPDFPRATLPVNFGEPADGDPALAEPGSRTPWGVADAVIGTVQPWHPDRPPFVPAAPPPAVPEPSIALMLLVGFTVLAHVVRPRRRGKTAAKCAAFRSISAKQPSDC